VRSIIFDGLSAARYHIAMAQARKKIKNYSYRIIIEPDERGTFYAYVPALPGCHTWADSFEGARKNIRDAIDVYLRSLIADGQRIPEDKGVEVMEMISLPSAKRRSLSYA